MTAKNMAELEKMLMKEMRKSMNVASKKMLADMYEETEGFYEGGEPRQYERTGALGDTPRVTAISESGNELEFDAYLDTSHRYTTGKRPTMEDVLHLANDGIVSSSVGYLRETVGRRGFWDRAEHKMEKTLNDTMHKFFD